MTYTFVVDFVVVVKILLEHGIIKLSSVYSVHCWNNKL